MYMTLLRTLWRVFTAIFVIGGAYATTFLVVPYLDQELPTFWSILCGYAVFAYIVLPFVLRFWRIVFRPNHIPRYTTTPDGWPADPVNIAIIASSRRQLITAMEKSGWYEADAPTFTNSLRQAYAVLVSKSYLRAPFSSFYLFGRRFDIGFEMPVEGKACPRYRHHVRLWQLREEPDIDKHNHFEYWLARFRHLIGRKQTVWIGAAVEDISPLGIRWRNLQLTHHNSHDHIRERDLIVDTLDDHGFIKSVHTIEDGEPFRMRSQNIGTSFIVDGSLRVVTLKNRLIPRGK